MIKYLETTSVTAKSSTEPSSIDYKYFITGIDSDNWAQKPLYVYATGAKKFYKILCVMDGKAYLSDEIVLANGTKLYEVESGAEKTLTVTVTRVNAVA